ncbi:MAG: hypothetical protein GC151_13880 [Betaproteobacteria bacterium]|nr:hypothetical protein [Betaproteobacteria bacterium]
MSTKKVGYQAFSNFFAHVLTPEDAPGVVSYAEIDSLSNSRQKVTPPSNCTAVEAWYLDPVGNSTGQLLVVVVDADSDADANAKIAAPGARAFCSPGNGFKEVRPDGTYITRIDVMMNAAESNSNKVFFVFRSDS